MLKAFWHLALLAAPVGANLPQSRAFSFGGVSLASDLNQVAARYPRSQRSGSYIYVDPRDSHDHISGIEVSGTGPARRVRISFETRPDGRSPSFPTCVEVQAKLERQFGRPQTIRRFSEEASRRADRVWRSRTQELTLICFAGSRGTWLAEAVQINARPPR
jgi:uncharacterized protein YcgL (UPF0745 family)